MRSFLAFTAAALALATSLSSAALSAASPSPASPSPEPARLLVHLLDYLAKDYGGAVKDGTVISPSEYKEQIEFSRKSREAGLATLAAFGTPASRAELSTRLDRLVDLIRDKGSEREVARLSRELQASFIQLTGLTQSPSRWPRLATGAKLFATNCASCHGAQGRGDGPAGLALDPKPANFMDTARMEGVSPFQAFNTIRLGVPGTPMAAFALPEGDTWDLAFYVTSLRAAEMLRTTGTAPTPVTRDSALLAELATSSDRAWLERHKDRDAGALAALRIGAGSGGDGDGGAGGDGSPTASIDLARTELAQAGADYSAQRYEDAKNHALVAYLSGVEPVEPRLKATDNAFMLELERRMLDVRAAIDRRAAAPEVTQAIDAATTSLDQARALLGAGALSPQLIFLSVLAIFLREGFEAVLVVIAILGVVKAAKLPRAAAWVHAGWIAACALGFVAWTASGWLIRVSGAQRELMEGVTSLLAVAILLYMGFWLHSRAQIGKWKEFIDSLTRGRLETALSTRGLVGLASVSFIAVFREALETVLFLRALVLEDGGATTAASSTAVGLGVAASFALVLGLAWALLKTSARLPIRRLFQASSLVMSGLAVILTGKGLHSLQESGTLSITSLDLQTFGGTLGSGLARWVTGSVAQFAGIYPTLETGIPQLLVLVVVIAMTCYERGKRGGTHRAAVRSDH